MSCTQITTRPLTINPKYTYTARYVSRAHISFSRAHISFSKLSLAVAPRTSKFRQHGPICVFGNKGEGNTESSPFKVIEKAIKSFKEPSIEELLKQQIAKNEFYKDETTTGGGGGGGDSGGSSGGGGGGGGGGSEDEGFSGIMNELSQVILATIGFIFLYILIIEGEDITRLTKDFIKFIFTRKKSIRLGRVFDDWSRLIQRLKTKPRVQEYWLENAIINTQTWYDGPSKYRRILRSRIVPKFDEIDDDLGPRSDDNIDDNDTYDDL